MLPRNAGRGARDDSWRPSRLRVVVGALQDRAYRHLRRAPVVTHFMDTGAPQATALEATRTRS